MRRDGPAGTTRLPRRAADAARAGAVHRTVRRRPRRSGAGPARRPGADEAAGAQPGQWGRRRPGRARRPRPGGDPPGRDLPDGPDLAVVRAEAGRVRPRPGPPQPRALAATADRPG